MDTVTSLNINDLLLHQYYNYIVNNEDDLLLKLSDIHDYTGKSLLESAFKSVPRTGSTNVILSDLSKWRELHHYLWEILHSLHWMDVSVNYRDIFSVASVFVAMITLYSENDSCSISRVIKIADLGILLGSDATSISTLQSIIRELTSVTAKSQSVLASPLITSSRKRSRYEYNNNSIQYSGSILDPFIDLDCPTVSLLVEVANNPSVLMFYESIFLKTKPVVLKESITDWPALQEGSRAWSNLQNIIVVAGNRTVPVETGKTYLSEGSGTKLMTISEFINDFVLSQNPLGGGYLAQHQLFQQVPELERDIIVPDYCALLTTEDEEKGDCSEVIVNAWFGPCGTVSPLHNDPYHNLLAQVVGYKYIRLYHPDESSKLYPRDGRMSNNSFVDLCDIDQVRFPLVKEAAYRECIIGPGDMLFIPRWHWHFVKAIDEQTARQWMTKRTGATSSVLSTTEFMDVNGDGPEFSFSVSFWWGARILKEKPQSPVGGKKKEEEA